MILEAKLKHSHLAVKGFQSLVHVPPDCLFHRSYCLVQFLPYSAYTYFKTKTKLVFILQIFTCFFLSLSHILLRYNHPLGVQTCNLGFIPDPTNSVNKSSKISLQSIYFRPFLCHYTRPGPCHSQLVLNTSYLAGIHWNPIPNIQTFPLIQTSEWCHLDILNINGNCSYTCLNYLHAFYLFLEICKLCEARNHI